VLARIGLLFFVITGLCAAAFTLGGAASAQGDGQIGIPQEHPLALALKFRQELGLNSDQVAHLQEMMVSFTQEFAPIRQKADSIQHRMQELQQSGKQDPEAGKALQREADGLGESAKPLFEKYAQSAMQLLTPEQREKLSKLADAHSQQAKPQDFVMMFVMEHREQLGISPQQFTKLQYLQADFIRAFAPIREQAEMLGMEAQEKFGKAGKEPPPEFRQQMEGIQKKVMQLQGQFSERAVKEVLQPNQRAMLEEMLRGDHRPGQPGG
jgi:hypothetical protein